MRSRWFMEQVNCVKGQTDMAEYVSLRDQRRMTLLMAPPAAQQEIGAILGSLQRRVWANIAEAKTLATLRDTLLPKLLSGELRVKSAESLLEGVA